MPHLTYGSAGCPKCKQHLYYLEKHPRRGEVFRCANCRALVSGMGKLIKERVNEDQRRSAG